MPAPRKNAPKNAAEVIHDLASKGVSTTGIAKHFKVSRALVARWFEGDEHLDELYEQGRDSYRQELEERIIAATVAGKNPAGYIYLLKSKFKMFDIPHQPKVDINVDARIQNVLKVTDHGTDDQWAAKAAAQQRALSLDSCSNARNAPDTVPELPRLLAEVVQSAPTYPVPVTGCAAVWQAKA